MRSGNSAAKQTSFGARLRSSLLFRAYTAGKSLKTASNRCSWIDEYAHFLCDRTRLILLSFFSFFGFKNVSNEEDDC